jgi:hypothetical protein
MSRMVIGDDGAGEQRSRTSSRSMRMRSIDAGDYRVEIQNWYCWC